MKTIALLFVMALTFGLLSHESKAQGTVGSNAFLKGKKALLHEPYRTRLQDVSTLLNKRNGMDKDLISLSETRPHEEEMVYRGLPKGITNTESKQAIKKNKQGTTGNAQVYMIDTVKVYNTSDTERYRYSYNPSGMVTLYLSEVWLNSQWTNSWLDTYTYDASGDELTYLNQQWQNGQWTNMFLDTLTSSASGDELTYLVEEWQNGQWTNASLDTYTFDASGNELSYSGKLWLDGQWTNGALSTYTYDPSGNQLTFLYQQWQNGQWTNIYSDTLTYDASGHLLTSLIEQWANGQWTNSSLDTFTYNASGDELTLLDKQWQNGQWTNFSLDTYTHDVSGHLLTSFLEQWANGQWSNDWLDTRAYDANGNLVSFTSVSWQDSAWVPSNDDVGVPNGPFDEHYFGYNVKITYKLTNVTGISTNKSNVPTSFSLEQNYPNPFNPTTTISFSLPSKSFVSLKVFDITGREVATIVSEEMSSGTYSRLWNAANVSSGIYFYRIQTGSYTQTKKLALLK